jgi:hypothetical protein
VSIAERADSLEKALAKTVKAIDKIKKAKGPMEGDRRICCADCFYGDEYVRLCIKEDNQEKWLKTLKEKLVRGC